MKILDKIIIGDRIRKFREQLGITQAELGEMIGVGATTIANYESSYTIPPLDRQEKLARALSIDLKYLNPDIAELIPQTGTLSNIVPFYKITNISGILSIDQILRDGYICLPSDMTRENNGLICTKVDDNSMAGENLPKSTYIIVDTLLTPQNGDIALIVDKKEKKAFIRNCICDGPRVMLMANGYGQDEDNIQTSIYDNNFKFVGVVTDAIVKIKKFR